MTLILTVNRLEGLDGKGERQLKIRFRDSVQNSAIVNGRDSVEVNQEFKWPLARSVEIADVLEFRLYNFSKFLANKLIGTLTISLQQLLQTSRLHLCERLIDANHSTTRVSVDFDIAYHTPGSQPVDWLQEDFYGVTRDESRDDLDEAETRLLLQERQAMEALHRSGLEDPSAGSAAMGNEDADSSTGGDGAGNAMRKTLGVPVVLDPTLHKMEDFQLSVTVIEAKQLSGANINPCIEVCIGERVQRTEIQMSTNSPYYNQYFAFEFHMSKWELFDQVIHIRAINKGTMMISRLLPGDLIGEFRLDVRTVYNAPDHSFFHKWACLIDPKDILGGPKGYVKCDINVIGKGEQAKDAPKPQSKKTKPSDDEDIEANLLLPMGVSVKRQMVELAVKIYRAEDLPKMNTDIMATLKLAFTGEAKPLIDPYVQVSFAGHSGKTKSKKNTYDPQWNEAVIFTEMFPPLCNRIRISVFDYDTVYSECIATHFVDLNQIMNASDNGFLPTFGPSWVNLYGTPRGYNYENAMRQKEELNLGLGEGVAYRGRLLLAIKTELKTDTASLVAGARVVATQPVPENVAGVREDFLLVGVIYEAGAMDEEIGSKGKPVSFELSIGTYGYDAGGKTNEALLEDDEDTGSTVKKSAPMWCNSVSPGRTPRLTSDEYYHVPFNERKPCLYMRCCYEDHRPRLFVANILEKLCSQFEQDIEDVQELVSRERRGVLNRLQSALQSFSESLDTAAANVRACKGSGGRTLLDMQRQRQVRLQLEKMKVKLKGMRSQLTADSVPARLKECRTLARLLREFMQD